MLHDISSLQNTGSSSLHVAAAMGHDAVVAVLLSNGADVNQANNDGEKPIDVAKTPEVKDMLIAHTTKMQEQEQEQEQEEQQPGQAVPTIVVPSCQRRRT